MSAQIHSHEQEIIILNKNSPNTSDFKCEVCCYEARSETVLKRHMTSKHKHKHKTNTHSTPEKERITTHNDSLNVSNTVEERTGETSFSCPEAEDPIPDFNHHDPLQHISSPLTSTHNPSTIWTCYICKKGFNEFEYRKNHMIEVHNF